MSRVTEEIRSEGRAEGRMEAKMETANNLYKMEMPLEQIAQVAKSDVSMVQEWLSKAQLPKEQ